MLAAPKASVLVAGKSLLPRLPAPLKPESLLNPRGLFFLVGVNQAAAGTGWQLSLLSEFAAKGDINFHMAVDGPTGGIQYGAEVALAQLQPSDKHGRAANGQQQTN